MEAGSVEDQGEGVCFNVYVYNVQPGIGIDYATGASWAEGEQGRPGQPHPRGYRLRAQYQHEEIPPAHLRQRGGHEAGEPDGLHRKPRPCWPRAIPPAASASRKAKPPRSLAPRRFFSVPAGRTGPETGRRTGWGRGRPPAAGAGAGCTCGGRGRRSPWTPWRWTAPPTSAPT